MPTHRHHKVWYWLRAGLAEVVRREPFTIRLKCATAEYTQPVSVGVDTGSQTAGVAANANEEVVYQMHCVARGNYQLYNGKRSEHKVWAPKKLHGWKLYELVEAKGVVGYIGGRRVKGSFVMKDVTTGKTLVEVTPRKLIRLVRPCRGWIITKQEMQREEERASSPV